MNAKDLWIKRIEVAFPYLLLLIAVSGLGFTLLIQRSDLTIYSLIWVIPLVLVAAILLTTSNANTNERVLSASFGRNLFPNLFLINILIFIITIIILFYDETRPIAYFALISLYSGIIVMQVISDRSKWTDNLILFEIILLSLNLMWGVTIKYPLYFGDTDTLGHMNMINSILETSSIDSLPAEYINYPLYHIFNAIGIEITGMSLKVTLFVLMGFVWQAGILLAFLLCKRFSGSVKFALTACLLFAASSPIIFQASYPIARSLAFIFMICWFYLILGKAHMDNKYLLLSLIAMSAMIMTHHLNVLFVIPVLILIYIVQLFLINKSEPRKLINPLFINLFCICCIFYLIWISSDLSNSTLPSTFSALLQMNFSLSSSPSSGYGFSIILGVIYFSFALLLGFLGMKVVFEHLKSVGKTLIGGTLALAGFILLLIYVPGPLDLVQLSNIISTSRIQLMVTPFIAFLMAYGISYLVEMKNIWRPGFGTTSFSYILPAILVIAMTFTATIGTGNAQDNDNLPNTSIMDTPYFTDSELASFAFLDDKADLSLSLYSDYQTVRNYYLMPDFNETGVITSEGIGNFQKGYLLLRIGELQRKGALTFVSADNPKASYRYSLDSFNSESDVLADLELGDQIYNDGYVQIFIVQSNQIE